MIIHTHINTLINVTFYNVWNVSKDKFPRTNFWNEYFPCSPMDTFIFHFLKMINTDLLNFWHYPFSGSCWPIVIKRTRILGFGLAMWSRESCSFSQLQYYLFTKIGITPTISQRVLSKLTEIKCAKYHVQAVLYLFSHLCPSSLWKYSLWASVHH